MGTFELINAAVSLVSSGIMTFWGQALADRQETQRMLIERYNAGEKSVTSARQHEAKFKGFYWVRSGIAGLAAIYFFIIPFIALLMGDTSVIVGYFDITQGFWPWSSDFESVTWVKLGPADASRVLVYDPVKNNIMISIVTMYFGNQFARRA
ncbi:MAG: hypothetical protein AAGA45_00015 [Verrucomicrobiota bacterium]